MIKLNYLGRPIANYCKKETSQLKELFICLGVLALCIYLYFFEFLPHSYSGETYLTERLVVQYVGFGSIVFLIRTVINWNLEMPYLNFTEDRFFFDNEGSETGGYWREVKSITTVEIRDDVNPRFAMAFSRVFPSIMLKKIAASGMPGASRLGWEIRYGSGSKFVIDPKEVETRGEDIMAVANEFWKNAESDK